MPVDKDDTDCTYSDAEFARDKGRIRKLVDRWVGPLGLLWWKLDIYYTRATFGSEPLAQGSAFKWADAARVWCKWDYMKASVEFDMIEVNSMDDDKLEEFFVHELCHVLVCEMREQPDADFKHEERVVACLTNAFLWVRQAGEADTKRERVKTLKKKPAGRKARRRGITKHGKP